MKSLKVSYLRQNANLQSCLSVLFGVDEFKIQEDFLQISELVDTENHFMSRSTTHTDLIDNPTVNYLIDTDSELGFLLTFFTEYLGSLAIYSETFSAFGESILSFYDSFVSQSGSSLLHIISDTQFSTHLEKMGVWILGASYNYTLRIDAKNNIKCGAHSCYEQTLNSGKICKPGKFLCYAFK